MLQDYGYRASASRSVHVHIPAFAGTLCIYLQRDGQPELAWALVVACLYNCKHGLMDLCVPVKDVVLHQRLRSATGGDLCVPDIATDRFSRQAFTVAGQQLWNQLPVTTRATSANSWRCFKRALKTFVFQWVLWRGGDYSKDYYVNIDVCCVYVDVSVCMLTCAVCMLMCLCVVCVRTHSVCLHTQSQPLVLSATNSIPYRGSQSARH